MERITKCVELLLKRKNDITDISQEQLSNAGLTAVILRDYQLFGVQWLYQCFVNQNGCILGDEMGLGKTVQVISLLLHIKSTGALNKPCLVISPLSVLGNWQTEFSRFAPCLNFLCFTGDKEKRAQIKTKFPSKKQTSGQQLHVVLTTYEMCIKESNFLKTVSWEVLVVDEAHRLKNHQSLLHQELIQFDHKVSVLLTGTPIQNNLSELYSLLSFVASKIFDISLMDEFVTSFSNVTNSLQDSSKLQRLLQPFLLRRVKSEVHLDLPKKAEVILFTGMSDLQKKYYKALLLKDYGAFTDSSGNRTRLLNILMQLRKCANHPYMFNGVEPEPFTLGEHLVEASGKLQLIDHLLRFLKKRNHKVLLFSQMSTMLDIIQDYLGLRGYSYERLDGSVRGEERYLAIKNFNETEDTFIFLLSTRAGGVGLNLVSADTVIFVDSDFNPQNDLQAAARAHRIGQTREVRIIRLLARSTVDEIFFNRAQEKLKLTNAVVEGGKFSHASHQVTSTKAELEDLLKFGFDKLSKSDESKLTDEDLVRILGRTHNGEWKTRQESEIDQEGKDQMTENNMYMYEGHDYSKETTGADKKAFDECLADLGNLETTERGSRRRGLPFLNRLPDETRKRKEFTPEELEERKRKREETVARRARLREEEEIKKDEEKKQKMEKLWLDNDYMSLNISLNEESDEEEAELDIEDDTEEEESREIKYVIGDVTRPERTGEQDAIIVHCVDNSGKWGSGGLFSAVSARSSKPEDRYELAGRMKDLNVGDSHLIPLGARENNGEGEDFVALIVAQTRDRHQRVSPIKLTALSEGLKKVHQAATEMNASVHLPRIGYATPSFNWYGTERLIKKHLASKRTPTFIYYFSRKGSKSISSTAETPSTSTSTSKTLVENQKKRKTPLLPNIFSDIKVYFHQVPEDEKRRLSRYIIAYDGEVEKYLNSSTTHVICSDSTFEEDDNLDFTNRTLVCKSWIDECLRRGELVDCSQYLVASYLLKQDVLSNTAELKDELSTLRCRAMASLKNVYGVFLVLCIGVSQVDVGAADYVGCFKQDFEIWIFRFPPGDYDSSRITPLACLDLCSPQYKYAAISGGNACFCGNRINASLKVNNSLCATPCEGSRDGHVLGTCGGAFYESVYELKRGITGLELKVSENVLVFSTTWFNASVFDGHETEFRFQIDDEVVSPFSKSSSVSYIFRKKGKHFVRVTARNKFTNIASVVKVVHVIDAMEGGVQVQCPAVALPGEEIICQGEWIRSTGNVKFYFGDETSENVLNDAPCYRVGAEINETREFLDKDNVTLGTFIHVSAVIPERGLISHWELVASKPGKIRVQVFRPYRNTTNHSCQNQSCSSQENSCFHTGKIACSEKALCLSWKQCVPADNAQRASHNCTASCEVSSKLDSDYQLWLEHTLNIRQSGYHVILIPRSKRFPVEAMDVIGWTSDGGQLGYLNNTLQKHIMVEYPVAAHPGSILSRNNYTKMHFGIHALAVNIRQPVHFEVDHVYSNTGVYQISSSATPTMFITVDDPITPFELKFPRLSTTNSSILFQTCNHNGSGVTYYWDFGDTSAVNSSNSSVTHIYSYPNWFTITLLATNAVSNYSLVAKIEVLDPIKECRFSQSIKAAVLGQSSFLKWRCRSGSNVSFLVSWGDGFMNYSHLKPNEMIGSNFSHVYSTAGNFSVKILASSPVGPNTTLTSQALVEIPITGLRVFLPFLPQFETLYLTTSSEITVERDLQCGTHVDCAFSFGDSNTSVVHSGRKVNYTYNTPGTYHITVTCYNLVSSIWGGLNTTIIVQDLVPLKNITLSVLPAIFGAPSVFQMRIPSGNFFRCYWDFGDGQRLTTAFPLINTSRKHLYKEVGTYTMNVTCRNDIGDSSVTVLADVDEPIRNATIVNENPFVQVNQSVEFLLKWKKGSRVQCCIDCDDNPYNKRHVANKNVTMVTIKHAYLQPGLYSIVARLWNSVSSSRVSVSRQIIVEYPVKGIQFFLALPSRCQSLSIASCVNVSADITPPSNASAFFDFGDGSSRFLENLDLPRKICVQKHNYAHPGLYNITVNVTNYVSGQFLMVSAYVGWSPLKGIWITHKHGSKFQQGLGSGRQYFPTGSTLRFELQQDRDDVDFEWKFGNKSLEQARKSVVEQDFPSRGCVNVTAVIKSLTLHEHCASRICIQDELQDLELNVKRPTYFKDATVFTFSAKNENACFALNLGDNSTVRFGDVSCRFLSGNLTTYSHEYKTQGNYTVELLSWNQVSSVRRTIKVSIWDEACPLPSLIILGGGPKDRPLIVTSSEVVVLEPVVIQKCYVATAVIIRWEVFVVKYEEPGGKKQRMELLHNVQREVISRNLTDYVEREQLSVVVRSLPTELFMVKLSVGFTGTDRDLGHVNGSNYTWLEVVRPPLVARIKGGISRSAPWKSLFILDGSESYDPANMLDLAMIQFSWSCRVINTSLSWTSNTTFDPSSGCFKNDSAILSDSKIITLPATDLFLGQRYIFRLQVKEGTRKSYFEQTVVVVDASIPAMDLSCVLNCEETVNPVQRLVLESKCSNCEPSSRLVYKWSIYVCSSTNNTGKPFCNEIPNFGLNTSTGLHQANLATLPNVLDIATSYKVRCTAWRSGSDSVGFVEYLFTVNRPPSGGNCTVTPNEGYALETKFSVHCVGWYDDDKPLTYLIEMLNGENTVYLSSGNQPNMTVYLPLGEAEKNFTIVVIVKVVDSKLFSSNSLHAVKVFQPNSLDYEQAVDDVREAIYAKEKNVGFGMVISLCSILNHRFNSSKQSLVEAKEIRKNIAKILSKTNITGFDEVRGISNSFQTLTAKPNEVGLETQSEVMRTIQSNMAVLHRLSRTSRDIADIGTSLHTVVSNIVEAALLENATMATQLDANATKGMNKTNVETREPESIKEAFQTLDQINNVMLSQVVAGDRPTVIKTTNYDVHLMRQSLEDLTMDNRNSTDLQVKFQDAASLLEHSNLTLLSVLGFTVIDLSKSPNSIYNLSADQINSNVLRLNLNDMNGSPVDLSKVDVDIFVDRKSDDFVENIAEINTLSSWKTMKIHKFNRTTEDTALVIKLQPVDSRIKFQALLRVGQAPDSENYDFQNEFPNTSSSNPPLTWVLSHDLLRQSASQEYFLGVKLSEREVGVNFNYSLRLFWAKCLMLEDGEDSWKSSGCKVGLRTSLRRTHCVCRPSQPQFSSENARHDSRVQRSISNSRHARSTMEKTFTMKGIFKISVGAGVFPTLNKIDFGYVFDANISDNPLALIAVLTAFGVFLIILIYARRQDRKDSEKIGASPLYDNDPSDKYFYEITVYTGCVYDAGTTANVSIILSGSEADVHPRTLWDPKRQCFQRGGIDTFLVSSPDYIGGISYLQVWHDNTGPTPAWSLDKVVVRDLNDNKSYLFINETWLAVEKGQGTVQTVLFPASKQEMIEFKHLFNTTTQKSLKDRHLWFSVFARPVDSRFTRVQRLSCCLTLLYCTMLTNAMFYQRSGTPKSESTVTIGPFTFGMDEIGIGIISAFIILPPNAIFVWIFRSVKPKPSEEEIRAMKEESKFWWFYELFSCCFKSQQSFLVMMSRGISDYLYASNGNVQREDQNEKDCSPPSDELVVDTEFKVQIPKESIQMLRKSKRLQTSIVLPYWYIYVAWSGLCLTSITCVFFLVLYGLQFGRDVSARWLSSMTVSIIQDVFISEPLKVFVIATVVALIIKKPPNLEREEASARTFQYHQPLDENNNMKEACETSHAKPPLKKDLEKARAKRLKEIRTCALLKELVLYVFFLLCLSVVTYRNKNPLSYEMNKAMNDMFVVRADGAGKSFEQVSDVESFYSWANATLLNGLYSRLSSYNRRLSPTEAESAVLGNLKLIGQVRLRQTRVKQNSCVVHKYFRNEIKQCHGWYSSVNKDTSCYDVGWTALANGSQCDPSSSLDPWKFLSDSRHTAGDQTLTTTPYDGGGFVVDFQRSNFTDNSKTIAFLRKHNWLDSRTRAIFIEFNVYSASLNLFCLSKLAIEVLPTNGMIKQARFTVTKLFALSGVLDLFSVVSHVFIFVFFLIFIYREAKQVYRLKLKYLSNFWHVLQGVIVLLILACVVIFFLRLAMVNQLLTTLETNQSLFMTFDHVAFIDMLLTRLIAFLVFLSWIRVTKFLRFNKRLLFLQDTLGKIAKPITAFSIVLLTLVVAYAHSGYLLFRELPTFRDVPTTFVSVSSLLMGHFDFPALESSNRILGPVFLFSAMFFGVFILMNLFIALILESFLVVKAQATRQENKYDLIQFVAKQLRGWIGMTGSQSPVVKSLEDTQQEPCDSGMMCDQSARRTKSLKDHIRKKERVLKMAERCVSRLELGLESVLLEDWAEEMVFHKLLIKSMSLARSDWFDEEEDILEEHYGNEQPGLKLNGMYPKATTSYEDNNNSTKDECVSSFSAQRPLSTSDLIIEEIQFQRF